MTTVPARDDQLESLDGDCTPADIIDTLKRLPFRKLGGGRGRGPTHCAIQIDRHVRDYFLRLIKQR